MIHPKVGPHVTLLERTVTDAAVSLRSLQSALTYTADRSFNSVSVDRDMSTHDTIVAFANGTGTSDGGATWGLTRLYVSFPGRAHALCAGARAACLTQQRGCDQVRASSVTGASSYGTHTP